MKNTNSNLLASAIVIPNIDNGISSSNYVKTLVELYATLRYNNILNILKHKGNVLSGIC